MRGAATGAGRAWGSGTGVDDVAGLTRSGFSAVDGRAAGIGPAAWTSAEKSCTVMPTVRDGAGPSGGATQNAMTTGRDVGVGRDAISMAGGHAGHDEWAAGAYLQQQAVHVGGQGDVRRVSFSATARSSTTDWGGSVGAVHAHERHVSGVGAGDGVAGCTAGMRGQRAVLWLPTHATQMSRYAMFDIGVCGGRRLLVAPNFGWGLDKPYFWFDSPIYPPLEWGGEARSATRNHEHDHGDGKYARGETN